MFAGADIAGVDAQPFQTRLQRGDGQAVVKMDVRDKRQIRTRADGAQGFGGGLVRHGQTHGLAAPGRQTSDLGQGGVHVAGVRIGHALDHDRRAAADNQPAQPDGAGFCVAHALPHRENCGHGAGRRPSLILRRSCMLFPDASQVSGWNVFCIFFCGSAGNIY